MLLLGGVGLALLSSSDLQTRAVQVVATELSNALGSTVHIGRVSYRMPASVRIEDFYIEDQQHDTLLYAHEVHARLKAKALLHNEVRFSKATIEGAYVNIHNENYAFLMPLFASSDADTVASPMQVLIAAPNICVTNSRVYVDDYHVDLDNLHVHLQEFSKDTIALSINELEAEYTYLPYCGKKVQPLVVKDLDMHVMVCNRFIQIPHFALELPHSTVGISGIALSSTETKMQLDRLDLYPPDLAMLEPSLVHLKDHYHLQAQLDGTFDSLLLREVRFKYNNLTILRGDVFVSGMPDWNQAYIKATCQDLYVNAGIVQDIISDLKQSPFRLPTTIHNLGQVHYRGQITGRPQNLVLKGAFRTRQGTISTDGTFRTSEDLQTMFFSGGVGTTNFHLGRLLESEKVGDISLSVITDARVHQDEFDIQGALVIDSLFALGNTYRDLHIDGHATNGLYTGTILIQNPDLAFRGSFDHRQDSLSNCSTYLSIDSLMLRYGSDSVMMQELEFSHIAQSDGTKNVKLTSDYLTGALVGQVDYATLLTTLKKQTIHYLPSLYSQDQQHQILAQPSNNNFRFYLYGRELRRLQRFFQLPYRVSDYPVMKGYVSEADQNWILQGYVPYVLNGKNKYEDITFSIDNLTNRANLSFAAKSGFTQLLLHSFAEEDSCHVSLELNNIDPSRTDSTDTGVRDYDKWEKLSSQIDFIEGDVNLTASIAQYANAPLVDVHLYPSYIQYGDSTYFVNESRLSYSVADTLLVVDHFRMGTETQFVEANGIGSSSPKDVLSVHLGQLNAEHLLRLVLPEQTLTVQGAVSGWANVYSLFSTPAFEADIKVDSTGMNGYYIGETRAKMTIDTTNYNILLDADVVENGHRVAHVDGLVETLEQRWGLEIYPDSFSIAFINHWPAGYIEDLSGRIFGKVNVFGAGAKTWVTAAAYADNVGITIPYTGCRYFVSDSVFMDSTSIRFPDLTLHDEEGNEMYFDGTLSHNEYFADFKFDLLARPNHTLVFNLPYQPQEMLSGHAYATGDVRVFGDEQEVMLTANATASSKSSFRFNIGYTYSASSNNFVTFYDHHDIQKVEVDEEDEYEEIQPKVKGPGTRFKMALNIEVDPQLDFGLVLNATTGDEINANGDGAFTVGYDDRTGAVSMVGTYTLTQGTMGFTVANVLRRTFSIAEGSSIVWSGDAENPTLNVTADYTTSASLKDLFGSDVSAITTSRTNIPVTTSINLTGGLDDPQIRFGLSLPRSEREIEDKVRGVINTEEMLMRQVVYLLVFNRFFTPEYMASANNPLISTNAVYSILSSTVTTQINRWLGKLTDVFSMGVNIRKEGTGAQSSYEAEAKFQLQPIDRLIINGDVGYRYNDITNRPFFGDVDVEYLLTQNGKFRVKAYSHMVDKYSLRQASTIQGVGFVFKHDFNWPKAKRRASAGNE